MNWSLIIVINFRQFNGTISTVELIALNEMIMDGE
jgi:hypothetical protein